MTLSDILSKEPNQEYKQIDYFLVGKKGSVGQKVEISVGKIALNFFCEQCGDMRTFFSLEKLDLIFLNKKNCIVNSLLTCVCKNCIPISFIIECETDITGYAPKVKILKKFIGLQENMHIEQSKYSNFNELLDKAKCAYYMGFGAGAIVYLRKIFEKIIIEIAKENNLEYSQYEGGNPKNFNKLLQSVNDKYKIIPEEFSNEGYKLFKELSTVVHGDYSEETGLEKFNLFYRLIIGILDNMNNKQDFTNIKLKLGWIENNTENAEI